jgi:hypothetical protein
MFQIPRLECHYRELVLFFLPLLNPKRERVSGKLVSWWLGLSVAGVQLVRAHQHALRAFPMHDRHLNSCENRTSSLRYHADVILCFQALFTP